ncbi:MAG TPA: cell division protein FtsQ/DivIB [Burkholderiales bacterium]|nr:cell division protein FtsQ/DivIB [Burkholderiales bacterium]
MWDNAAVLNRAANLLYGAAALLIVYGCIHYVVHLPVFPLREIRVIGDVGHVTNEQVAAVTARELRGNFFTVDLAQAREAFEKLPWVRTVNVRRQWPDRLEVAVEEHQPLARWGSTALVNAHGEVFEAAISSKLPVFFGPEGTAVEVVARYAEFDRLLAPIGRKVVLITLSARRAWQLRLDDGTVLQLGRENLEARLAGFVSAYPRTVARLPQPPSHVDLRYSNGFAVRTPGLKWDARKA